MRRRAVVLGVAFDRGVTVRRKLKLGRLQGVTVAFGATGPRPRFVTVRVIGSGSLLG